MRRTPIRRDWAAQREDHGQDHWELFLGGGLIDRATAERWADKVWPAEDDGED